jgi:hypothetical protein
MANAVSAPASVPRPVVRAAPVEEPEVTPTEPGISVPLEGTGYEIGVQLGNESVTISAEPSAPGDDRPPLRGEIPITVPALPPATEDEEPPRL